MRNPQVYRAVSLAVHPHFQYQNEEKKLAQPTRSYMPDKVALVGCNLFFILALKIKRNSKKHPVYILVVILHAVEYQYWTNNKKNKHGIRHK